ncbi:myosin-16-like [Anneissia japonica]|uniref:myosin-16-like n=1 Tax=Anneissia japonica TaxID=1529436 RepID=UPI0014254B75|nr:myosin-16-like [Anneissia japonica]
MEVNIGEKEELRRAQSDLDEKRKTVMRLKSAIEELKKVFRENRNIKEEVEANARKIESIDDELRASKRTLGDRDRMIFDKDRATTNLKKEIAALRDELAAEKDKVAKAVKERSDDDARSSVTLEKIKDELRHANREAAAAKDLQRRSATKLEETEKLVESLKERLDDKGRSTANANKEIASLRDELRAEREKVATDSKERSDGDARRSAFFEKIKEDLRLATRKLETAKDRERRSAKKLEESEREVESLKEWLDVTEKNHEANLREFCSSAESDKAKAISDLETAKADHTDRTDILRTEIADFKEKLAEATRKESLLIKDVEKLTALTDDNEKESRRMEKHLSDKDRSAIDLRNEIDTLEEKMKRNESEIDDQMTAYKEEIERNVKRMKELDATIAKKIREAAGLEDKIAVLKEGKERDGRKIKGLGVQLANKGREATALKDDIAALQTDLSRAREECADDRSTELSVILERTSRDLAAAKEAEIRLMANHENIEKEIPQWKQWVEELEKARDESHESHAKELGSLRDDLEREKSDAETKLATAKASHSDDIENLRTQISFIKEKESKLRRDTGKLHAALKEREENYLDRIAKLESDKISRSAEAEEALEECASLSEKLKLATDSERRSKEDLDRWQAEKRSWQAMAERRSADLDKLRDLLNTSERERANLESQLSNVDKNLTESKETDSLKRELERHRQEIRQLEQLLIDVKREKSGGVQRMNDFGTK